MKKTIKYSIITIICIILLIAAYVFYLLSKYEAHYTTPKNRIEAWQQDLEHLQKNFFTVCKGFNEYEKTLFYDIIDNLNKNIETLSNNEIKMEINRAIAIADNGHTSVSSSGISKIGLRVYWFSDGLYVIKATPEYEKYLGFKLIEINNRSIEELLELLQKYIPGKKSYVKYKSPHFFISPDVWAGTGIIPNCDSIPMTFLDRKNNKILAVFPAGKKWDESSWRNLTPENEVYKDTTQVWKHILTDNNKIPLYLSSPNKSSLYKYFEDKKTLYLQINSTVNRNIDLSSFIEEIESIFTKKDIQSIIYDIRLNTGGNYLLTSKLDRNLPKWFNGKGKVYIISGNPTFSAAIVSLARLKYFSEDKAVIVGEPAGDWLKFWAEGLNIFILPNSKMEISTALFKHDWIDNKFIPFKTFYMNLKYGVSAKEIDIDIPISLSFQEYISYEDPVLKKLFEVID